MKQVRYPPPQLQELYLNTFRLRAKACHSFRSSTGPLLVSERSCDRFELCLPKRTLNAVWVALV